MATITETVYGTVKSTGKVAGRVRGQSVVDRDLDASSANPVQNAAIYAALAKKADVSSNAAVSQAQDYDRLASMAMYPGRNIIDVLGAKDFADAVSKLHALAQARSAGDLRIMDYLDVTPASSTVNKGNAIRFHLGMVGQYYQYGDTANPFALGFVAGSPIDMTGSDYATNTSYMMWNATNTNNGTADQPNPYLTSQLHKWELEEFLPALPTALQNVLVSHRHILESRYSASGALTDSTGWAWADLGKIISLSETEVYGQCVWGTKGYSVGIDEQWPIFRQMLGRGMRYARDTWWLRSVGSGSSAYVCYVNDCGRAGCSDAAHTWVRPRPCFLIG